MMAGLVGILLTCPARGQDDEPAFERLFDGESLEGWEGNRDWFRVEQGAIVGGHLDREIPRNEFLSTRKEYGDFELRIKVKLIGEATNAGVQLRSRRIPDHHEMIGYQADAGQGWWGKLYDESRRNRVLAGPESYQAQPPVKAEDWNQYVIRCQGQRIQLWLNAKQTVDYVEPEEEIPQKGLIAVQIHSGGPGEAWYKDIEIRPLPAR
jgi:hypothetical protein